jgi:hypothetical protein
MMTAWSLSLLRGCDARSRAARDVLLHKAPPSPPRVDARIPHPRLERRRRRGRDRCRAGCQIVASVVVVWQLKDPGDTRERHALRLIGGAFIALAIYIASQATYTLITANHPHSPRLRIIWTAATVGVMLALAAGKARTGKALKNPVLQTEGRVTLIDAYLAAAVLLGLVLNAAAGWWLADPLAGLVIVYYGLREGRQALTHSH